MLTDQRQENAGWRPPEAAEEDCRLSPRTPTDAAEVFRNIAPGDGLCIAWPLGKNLAETQELAHLAREKGVRTLAGMQSWQTPLVTKARAFIKEGRIGRVLSATWIAHRTCNFWAPIHPESFEEVLNPANGTQSLHIMVGHNLSAITRILGPLSSVSATGATAFPTVQLVDKAGKPTRTVPATFPDQWALNGPLKEHPGAVLSAVFSTSGFAGEPRPSLVFIVTGDKGSIIVQSYKPNASFIHIYGPERMILNGEAVPLEDATDHDNRYRNLRAFVENDEGDYPTFDDAVNVYKHIDAISQSVSQRRQVEVDI